MNYIKELNAFYDWLETNEVSPSAINLWYALMHINNKAGWVESFTVAESVLCVKTGLSDRTLRKVRNELKQLGRIDFVSRKGKAPRYNIISLERSEKYAVLNKRSEDISAVSSEVSSVPRAAVSSEVSSALLKEIKQNEIKQEDDKALAPINPFQFFEQEGFGSLSSFIADQLGSLVDDFGEDRVLGAMKESVLNGARNLKYVKAILNNPNSNKPKGAKYPGTFKQPTPKTNDASGLDW